MRIHPSRHLSYANIMSTVAVFVALGGSSYAAVKLGTGSVKTSNIAKRAVKGPKVAKNAVSSATVKDGTLLTKDFKKGQVPAGAAGPKGEAGPAGPKGDAGAPGPVGPATGVAGGDLTGSFPNPKIGAAAIDTAKLVDGAVTGPKLGVPLTLSSTLGAPFLSLTGDTDAGAGGSASANGAMLAVTQTGNTTGASVYGETQSQFADFGTTGVMGVNSGTGGIGVVGYASNATGNGAAMLGYSKGNGAGVTGSSAKGDGVFGTSDGAGKAGVAGNSPSYVTGGTAVKATASGSSSVALRATSVGSGGSAAIFTGNVQVVGTLSKSAGSFKIDDPIDPTHKYLSHSFVESPDMKNIYDGVVATDARGFATVTMPDWFDALNDHFRYQLTVMGRSFARAIVWQELADRAFTIRSDQPAVKVSWQVTGIREDAYAKAHRIPVVEEKTGDERGQLLTP
jgi:hypothetical protein